MENELRGLFSFFVGFGLGLIIVASTVAAIALAVIGIGGHLLARTDRAYARIISFDPSTVASHAPYPAVAAVAMSLLFFWIARRLPPSQRDKRAYPRGRAL